MASIKSINGNPIVVDGSGIAENSIQGRHLQSGAVTNTKLATGAVKTANIEDGAVTSAKIPNNEIIGDNLHDGAVRTDKLADGSVTREKLSGPVYVHGRSLEQALVSILDPIDVTISYSQGGIGANGFSTTSDTDKVRSGGYFNFDGHGVVLLDIPEGLSCFVYEYKTRGNASSGNELLLKTVRRYGAYAFSVVSGHGYRIVVYADDGSNIAPSDSRLAGMAFYDAKIADGSIDSTSIADGAVTRDKLANEVITSYVHGANSLVNSSNWATYMDALDFNAARPNTVLTFSGDSAFFDSVANMPVHRGGTLMSYTSRGIISGAVQLYVDATDSDLYWRIGWGSGTVTWSAWKKAAYSDPYYYRSYTTLLNADNYSGVFTDFNEAPLNTGLLIMGSAASQIPNAPSGEDTHSGFLLTLAGRNNLSGVIQLYVDSSTREWKARSNWGALPNPTWTPWRTIRFGSDPAPCDFTDMSMFERIGVLGDSYCSGSLYLSATDKKSNYAQAWGAHVARQHGIEFVPYAVGGWSTYNFLYNDNDNWRNYGSYKLEQDFEDSTRVCGLYVIAYGINDSNPTKTWGDRQGGPTYIGSAADIDDEDWHNNVNSYWGNMSKIISMIKEGAPDALIVLTTLARFGESRYDAYSAEIPAIAERNGVRYVTLTDDPFFTSSYYLDHHSEGHPTAQLYAGMAKAISRLIQSDMVEHPDYYQSFRGINNPR